MVPYYSESGVTIYHGDCQDILSTLADKSADLVLADPPYNYGVPYGLCTDNLLPEQYAAWCASWFADARRIGERVAVFPGHGNMPVWWAIEKPAGVACWFKPGNPGKAGVFQFCEWEPLLVWGWRRVGGSDVFRVPYVSNLAQSGDAGGHPNPKPVLLFKQILARTKVRHVVFPFLGSGTGVVAAKTLGVEAIGIEIEERWCEVAAKRLQQSVMFGAEVA